MPVAVGDPGGAAYALARVPVGFLDRLRPTRLARPPTRHDDSRAGHARLAGDTLKPTHAILSSVLIATLLVGCRTKRTLIVDSVPEGALVRLDEEVIGTTPLRHEFTHGGRRRVSIYHPGHRTWSQVVDLEMPWYARFPMDVLTEVILPLGIDHEFAFEVPLVRDTLEESSDAPAIEGYLTRARALWAAERGSLEAKPQASDGQ